MERGDDISLSTFLSGGGETGGLIRAYDWSESTLGSPVTWPESLQTLVAIILGSKQPMFVISGREQTLLYNDSYAEILADKHPMALGCPFLDVWSEIRADLLPIVSQAYAGEPVHMDDITLLMQRRGYIEEAHFAFSYTPVRDKSGDTIGLYCACMETTRQVLAERALKAGVEYFRSIADDAPAMLWITDPSGYCTYLNRQWYEFTGQTEEEALGIGWTHATHPDDQKMAEEAFLASNASQAPFYIEYRLRRADGTYRWAIDTADPRFGADGQFLGYVGAVFDIDERKLGEQHLLLMVNELNHRVKNSLSTVQAIATQTFRNPDSFERSKKDFSARLSSLAQAHDILTDTNWKGSTLRKVIDRTVGPHHGDAGDRFDLDGPDVLLTPKSALAMSMAFHELCTNAVKYGALSVEWGKVFIAWSVLEGPDGDRLHMTWTEIGGPPVAPPDSKGFGSRLIEYGLAAELGGSVAIAFDPNGVICTIDASLPTA